MFAFVMFLGFFFLEDRMNEDEVGKQFDRLILETGLFRYQKEVTGYMIQPFVEQAKKLKYTPKIRIDRVLFPTNKLYDLNWFSGLIGIELKKPDTKLGPVTSQMIDYKRSVFISPKNSRYMIDFCFLYPHNKEHGPIASFMAQNGVGTSCVWGENSYQNISFFCGENKVLKYYFGRDETEVGKPFGGNKGSR